MSGEYRICPTTNKRGYASRRKAKAACARAQNRIRAYWCKSCGAWHTTNAEFGGKRVV